MFAPASPGKLPAHLKDCDLVVSSVESPGDSLRSFADLLDRGSEELVFPYRYDVEINKPVRVACELEARWTPELGSKIGFDQAPN
jgi:hypothetical protein